MSPVNHDLIQRVACYVRVSTTEQKLRGLSPDAQRDTLQRYAEEHNLKIVEWYEDLGVSGRKPIKKRPELQRMIIDAEHGKFDRILFIKLDRYFRSVAEYNECQKRLEAKNVKWTATEEKYDLTTASGRYWVTQKLAMAEYEADNGGERILLVNEYKVKTGQPLVGAQSLGIAYTIEKDEEHNIKKVVKDPATEQIVMDYINHFLIHQNKGAAHVYINNKYGTSYSYNTLGKILTDTKTYGHYRGNDFYCEPYISKDVWDKIQDILSNNIKEGTGRATYLFTGLVLCPECGRKMTGKHTKVRTIKKNNKTYKYDVDYHHYRCSRHFINKDCSFHKQVNEEKIEAHLLSTLNVYVDSYINAAHIEDARVKNNSATDRIKQLKGEMTRLNNMYQKNRISEEKYDREFEELEAQLLELERHLEPVKERDLTIYEELLKSGWKELYNALSRENKRSFWRKYIKYILLTEDGSVKDVIFF